MDGSYNDGRTGPEFLSRPPPRLPRHDGLQVPAAFGAASALLHFTVVAAAITLVGIRGAVIQETDLRKPVITRIEPPRVVVLIDPLRSNSGGGGGGGNRQPGPVSRAQAPGRDSITLPVAKPIAPAPQPEEEARPVQIVALDAKPLASDSMFQVGLLEGPVRVSPSQGPGSGGGAGNGVGTGIGSGRGPGVGPGSGGGTGGGVFRPGDGATPPTVLLEVRPSYSPEAMRLKIQGFVQLEAVVQRDGTPRDVRVIRSLDPGGLDRQAVLAVEQWRFKPGLHDGQPVDVLVTIVLDFRVH